MALEGITKVGELGLETPLNLPDGLNVTGVITATSGIQGIGIHSGGVAIHSGIITALNFVGTGNTFTVNGTTVDISISGGSGGASKVYDSTVFAYQNVIDSNITISLPYKTSVIYADTDVTVDIEPNVTLTVDDGVFFSIVNI